MLALVEEITLLKTENQSLKASNKKLSDSLSNYKDQLNHITEQIRILKKSKYGSSSERVESLSVQPSLFNELESEQEKSNLELIAGLKTDHESDLDPTHETITYNRKKKGKQKRRPLPEGLEREIVTVELSEDEKVCTQGGGVLQEIQTEVTEKLVTRPAEMKVREVHTKKYKCSCCKEAPVRALAESKTFMPGSLATEETVSFIIFSKFFQHLPLYRLEELYKLKGVELSRSVMASWLVKISSRLTPLRHVLEERLLNSGYVGIDETRLQVLDEKGRKAQTKSSMWVRANSELGIALFDYDISKGGSAVKGLLGGYKHTVQSDEHSCYNQSLDPGVLRLGCMMHARRKFFQAQVASKKGTQLATAGLIFFKKIYGFEELYKKQNLNFEDRHRSRLVDQAPLLEEFKSWLEEYRDQIPPKSNIGKAIFYSLKHWVHLTNYMEDGRYEVDNGFVERCIKPFAIGRKNWLFAQSPEGAEASSILYSLLMTINLNKKDPFETMVQILKKTNQRSPLTPEQWDVVADLILK